MMTKLYKKYNKTYLYWEIWEYNSALTIHWGTIGELGYTKEVKANIKEKLDYIYQKEIKKAKKDGYTEISIEKHYQLITQLKSVSNNITPKELNRRIKVEKVINHSLGWIGIGHTDGGDFGGGKMNIFAYVIDPYIAAKNILSELEKNNINEDIIIASRQGETIKVLYPERFEGEFSY